MDSKQVNFRDEIEHTPNARIRKIDRLEPNVEIVQSFKYVEICTDLHIQDLGDFHNQTFLKFFPKIKSDGVESIEHHFV